MIRLNNVHDRTRPLAARLRSPIALIGLLAGLFTWMPAAQAAEPIKVGILHSLSGTMAISETSLKDVALMAIEEINAAGGLLGRPVEPVVVDPASDWPLFAEKARELIQQEKGAVVFGSGTSVGVADSPYQKRGELRALSLLEHQVVVPVAVRLEEARQDADGLMQLFGVSSRQAP